MFSCFSLLCISYVYLCSASQTGFIWKSTFITNATNWVLSGGAAHVTNAGCPTASSCYELQPNGTISRFSSTIGYHSIRLRLQMQTEALSQSQECQIWYRSHNTWTKLDGFVADTAQDVHAYLPTDANNNTAVGIRVLLKGGQGTEARCRINNAYLSGIQIITNSSTDAIITTSTSNSSLKDTAHPTLKLTIVVPVVLSTASTVILSSHEILNKSNGKYESRVNTIVLITCILLSCIIFCLCAYFLYTIYQYMDKEEDRKRKESQYFQYPSTKKKNSRIPGDFTIDEYSTIITPTSAGNNGVFGGKYLGTPTRNKRPKFRAIDSESTVLDYDSDK